MTGEFIREWDEDLFVMAEGDPDLFYRFTCMPIYDFNFRILALRKNQNGGNHQDDMEPFGLGHPAKTD